MQSHRTVDLPPKTVMLTFDDGPNAHKHVTDSVLAVLKKHDVRAYFCVIGSNVEHYPDIVKRIHTEGHTIVNHGYTDGFVFSMNADEIAQDIRQCDIAVGTALGIDDYHTRYYRPPNGLYRKLTKRVWQQFGMQLLPATLYVFDAQRDHTRADRVLKRTVKKIRKDNGGIILLHDGRDNTGTLQERIAKDPTCSYDRSWIPAVVDSLITVLKKEGFVFK